MKVKGITIICFISLILLTTNLLAATNITAKVSSSTSEIEGGQDVIITLKFDEYLEVKKGLNAYKETLVYDKAVFEEVIEEKEIIQKIKKELSKKGAIRNINDWFRFLCLWDF